MSDVCEDAIKQLRGMLKGIRFTMLTTEDADGGLRSRPMTTQELDEDGTLWFFTGKGTSKVDEIRRHQEVNLSYVNEGDNRFVSVAGKAELIEDRAKMAELWNPLYKAWFPDGLEDPELSLLKVSVERVEYWDSASSKLTQLVGFVKAVVTGKQADVGTYGQLDVSSH